MDAHWRDSMRPARFFMLDARSAAGVMIVLLHASIQTFVIGLLIMALFWALEQRGLSVPAAIRAFRSWLAGQRRPAVMRWSRSRYADYFQDGPL